MSGSKRRIATVLAPAKVNLALRVLGRRPDGYHEIETLFQAVDLCDQVTVEVDPAGAGTSLEVEGADVGPQEENLAHRAAARFLEELGSEARPRVSVRLTKHIPVGAGLGGGSSDAAAVLRCLAELLDGHDPDRLRALAIELGSDVPFFLGRSPLARGWGRGEVLEPLPALPEAELVLVSPPVHVSTAEAYTALRAAPVAEARGAPPAASPPSLDSWNALGAVAHNDFQPVIAGAYPQIGRALEALRAAGAAVTLMTGSGSTCFGYFHEAADTQTVATELESLLGWSCRAVRTLTRFPEVAVR